LSRIIAAQEIVGHLPQQRIGADEVTDLPAIALRQALPSKN
jgi:hypothetical protein